MSVSHGTSENQRIFDCFMSVSKSDGAGFFQQPEFCHFLTIQLLCNCCRRINMNASIIASGLLYKFDKCDIVNDRMGVWHHNKRRNATRSSGIACRLDCLAVFVTGFAYVNAGINQSRQDCLSVGIKNLGPFRRSLILSRSTTSFYNTINDDERSYFVFVA